MHNVFCNHNAKVLFLTRSNNANDITVEFAIQENLLYIVKYIGMSRIPLKPRRIKNMIYEYLV